MTLNQANHERAIKFRDRTLAGLAQEAVEPNPVEAEGLVKLGLLLAAEVPPEEADIVLEALVPFAERLEEDTQGNLCEMLVMRGRLAEAERIWDAMEEIPKMHTQLQCLKHRLLEVAELYGDDVDRLTGVVEAILAEPVNTLERIVNSESGSQSEAVSGYVAVRMLTRTRLMCVAHAPILDTVWNRVARMDEASPEEIERMEAAGEQIAGDLLQFESQPPVERATGSPMIDWIHRMVSEGMMPGRGKPSNPKKYLQALRDRLYGKE